MRASPAFDGVIRWKSERNVLVYPTLKPSNDSKKKHSVGVKVATLLSGCELLYRFCGVNHVQDADAIVIAHTGLEALLSKGPGMEACYRDGSQRASSVK